MKLCGKACFSHVLCKIIIINWIIGLLLILILMNILQVLSTYWNEKYCVIAAIQNSVTFICSKLVKLVLRQDCY